MLRLLLVLLLFAVACGASGLYGALHNQISYTVSPEYFTKFKFEQFEINPSLPERVGAALVGWQASWWMGVVIGFFLIPFGLLIRGAAAYFYGMLRVFLIVVLTAMMCGLVALAVSFFTITASSVEGLEVYGNEISNPVNFLRAGAMHNFGYAGGLAGVITGGLSIIRQFLRDETGSGKLFS